MTLPRHVRIDADDAVSAQNLRAEGWRDIEVLETWVRNADAMARIPADVETAKPSDMMACQAIAAQSFKCDRLHMDPYVDPNEACQVKIDWVASAFKNAIGNIMVARDPNTQVEGFVIMKPEGLAMRIDLIAVHPEKQRKGVAHRLIAAVNNCAYNRGILIAGTQEANTAGRRMYQACGFRVIKRERTFHKMP